MNNSLDQITLTVHNCFAMENQPFYVSKYSCGDIMQELCIGSLKVPFFRIKYMYIPLLVVLHSMLTGFSATCLSKEVVCVAGN